MPGAHLPLQITLVWPDPLRPEAGGRARADAPLLLPSSYHRAGDCNGDSGIASAVAGLARELRVGVGARFRLYGGSFHESPPGCR